MDANGQGCDDTKWFVVRRFHLNVERRNWLLHPVQIDMRKRKQNNRCSFKMIINSYQFFKIFMSFWSETLERPNYMVAGKFVGEVEHVQHAYTWTLLAKIYGQTYLVKEKKWKGHSRGGGRPPSLTGTSNWDYFHVKTVELNCGLHPPSRKKYKWKTYFSKPVEKLHLIWLKSDGAWKAPSFRIIIVNFKVVSTTLEREGIKRISRRKNIV